MNKENLQIGFIGAGYMGYGMAHNLLKKKYNVNVFLHKNTEPIEKLVIQGAKKYTSLKEISVISNVIILCVTNTPVALKIINEIAPMLEQNTLIIDITTHQINATIKIEKILSPYKIKYSESPVMGGPVQSEEGILGAIVGCNLNIFEDVKFILNNFCKDVFYFGKVGEGTKAKLISNFLSLGTATFVIETLKLANSLEIDIKKLYNVAKLGSGNSGALNRIAEKAINNDYKGYIFSVNNTLKDLTYINELVKELPNSEKLSSLIKSFYQNEVDNGKGDLLISELIKE